MTARFLARLSIAELNAKLRRREHATSVELRRGYRKARHTTGATGYTRRNNPFGLSAI